MKKNKYYISTLLLFSTIVLSGCFNDEFTEQDLLDNMSYADLNVVLTDPANTGADLSGFEVTIINDGSHRTEVADTSGFVYFRNVKIGSVPVRIEKDGFITIRGTHQLSAITGQQSRQQTLTVPVLPTSGDAMATISGEAVAGLDLASESPQDIPAGIELFTLTPAGINMPAGLNFEGFAFTAVSDGGEYSIEVPAGGNGIQYNISYANFTHDQQIGIHRYPHQPEFPSTEPAIVSIETEFGTAPSVSIPTVSDVYAVVDVQPSGNNVAILGNIQLNATGGISGISILNGGRGYSPNINDLPIRVEGLTQGAGAVLTANTDADGTITSINIDATGSRYTTGNVNRQGARNFNSELGSGIIARSGANHIRRVDFGTGISRKTTVQ